MSSRAAPSARQRRLSEPDKRVTQRTHAERSSETRAKVIKAAIRSIAENGYKNTTVTRIAALSGVSWGGIQHQFGNKAAIIQAVLDHALDEFILGVQRISTPDDKLETRVKVFVQGAWRLVTRPGFLALLEILLSHRHAPHRTNPALRYRARVWRAIIATWDYLFGSLDLSQEQIETARRMTFTTLGGMAIESIMRTDSPSFDRPLVLLQANLVELLREARDEE
jgi:AcrR family transcriptional regulator